MTEPQTPANPDPQPDTPPPADDPATLRQQLDARNDELATAEAQRDELAQRLTETENRHAAESTLHRAGAVDPETALLLLRQRMDFDEPLDTRDLADAVQQLLLDKPFLLRDDAPPAMPPMTRTPREPPSDGQAELAQAARTAAGSGNRRDIARYLRLRRQVH